VFSIKFECADHESKGISWISPSVRPQSVVKVAKIDVKKANIFQKIKNGKKNFL
jgi:hypothetical protein